MQEGSTRHIAPSPPDVEEFAFMQGLHDEMAIVDLSPEQMGVLLTFAPPSSSYILDSYALNKMRRSMSAVTKVLAHDETDQRKSQASNILMSLPYMFLQYEKIDQISTNVTLRQSNTPIQRLQICAHR